MQFPAVVLTLVPALPILLAATPSSAQTTRYVETAAEFATAMNASTSGDTIEIEAGYHDDWGELEVDVDGVTIQGVGNGNDPAVDTILREYARLSITASQVVVKTLRFQDPISNYNGEAYRQSIAVSGSATDVEIRDVYFKSRGNQDQVGNPPNLGWLSGTANISLSGKISDVRILSNWFDDHRSTAVHINDKGPASSPGPDHPADIRVEGNLFVDGSSETAIQAGTGGTGPQEHDHPHSMRLQVLDNEFRDHVTAAGNGTELLEIKTDDNLIRGNSFENITLGHVSNRGGQHNVYDGNLFYDMEPRAIRIYDAHNVVTNNLFIGNVDGIMLPDGAGGEPATDTLVANNTFVDQTQRNIRYATGDPDIVEDNIIVNNVLIGAGDDESTFIESGLETNNTISRNVFYSTGSLDQSDPRFGSEPFFEDPDHAVDLSSATIAGTVTFGSSSYVLGRGLAIAHLEDYASRPWSAETVRPTPIGADLGHIEAANSCPGAPTSISLSGNSVVTEGTTISLTSTVSDDDGLGYPIFWVAGGLTTPIPYVWDFDGASPAYPLAAFSGSPSVTFYDAGLYHLTLTVNDEMGCSTVSQPVDVLVIE